MCYSPDSTQINTNNNQCSRKATNPKLDSREELSTNLPSTTFQCQTEWLARNRFSLTRTMHTANVSLVLITESRLVYCIRWANPKAAAGRFITSRNVSTAKRFTLPVFAHEQTHSLRNKTLELVTRVCARVCLLFVFEWVGHSPLESHWACDRLWYTVHAVRKEERSALWLDRFLCDRSLSQKTSHHKHCPPWLGLTVLLTSPREAYTWQLSPSINGMTFLLLAELSNFSESEFCLND